MSAPRLFDTLLGDLDQHRGVVFGRVVDGQGSRAVTLASLTCNPGLVAVASRSWGDGLPQLVKEGEEWELVRDDNTRERCAVLPWSASYNARVRGVVDTAALESASVIFVGLGSVGTACAIAVAKAGVGMVTLMDPERVAVENLIRTPYGVEDVGAWKVEAARELVLRANPRCYIRAFREDVYKLLDGEYDPFNGADLIVNAASTAVGFELASRFHRQVPMLFPGMHARAASGELLVTLGKDHADDPCFSCFRSGVQLAKATQPSWDYGVGGGELAAQPGLGSDITHLTALTSSVALRILSRSTNEVVPPDRRLLLLSNKMGSLFEHAFETRWVTVPRNPACPNHVERVARPLTESALFASLPESEP